LPQVALLVGTLKKQMRRQRHGLRTWTKPKVAADARMARIKKIK
jgi:hypothetical protein